MHSISQNSFIIYHVKFFMRNSNYHRAKQQSTPQHALNSNNKLFCVHHFFKLLMVLSLGVLSACSYTPTSVVEQPTTARAPRIEPPAANTGAIYNSRGHRALFEDRKPRGVGDIITINIQENTIANKSTNSGGSKDGEVSTSLSSLFGSAVPSATISSEAGTSYSDSSTANTSNLFSGSITTTVVEVLPNGYFLVSGEKQVAFDKGTEYVRFSGVINPDTVTIGNNVLSTQVADARIEYRTAAKLDAAEVANAFSRFFLSLGVL